MNDVQGVLHMLDLKSCSIVAVYQLDHGLVCRDEDGLQREKRSTFSFDTLSCNNKAKRPITQKTRYLAIRGKLQPSPFYFLTVSLKFKGRKGTLVKGPVK